MSDLKPCPFCGRTNMLCRYWHDEEEIWELYGVYPEDLLAHWHMLAHCNSRFPHVEDEDELASYITDAAVGCICRARVYGTIGKADGEYIFIRNWNRRVKR